MPNVLWFFNETCSCNNIGAFFCSLSGILNSKKSGGSNHLNLEESADEPKRRKKTAFGSGNTMSKGVNALRADLQTSEKTTLELKTENERIEVLRTVLAEALVG